MKKILAITGATGKKSGGALIDILAQHSEEYKQVFGEVRAIVREKSDVQALLGKISDIEICRGDMTNEHFLSDVLTGVDTLINIAGIQLSKGIVQVAVKEKVRRLILVHTTGIYSRYKAAGEEYRKIDAYVEKTCKENNILLTILRPTMIYGNIYDKNICTFIRMADKLKVKL